MHPSICTSSNKIIRAKKIIAQDPDITAHQLGKKLGHHAATIINWQRRGLITLRSLKTRGTRYCKKVARKPLKAKIEIVRYEEAPWVAQEYAQYFKWAWRVTASNGVECSGGVRGNKKDAMRSAKAIANKMTAHYGQGDNVPFTISSEKD